MSPSKFREKTRKEADTKGSQKLQAKQNVESIFYRMLFVQSSFSSHVSQQKAFLLQIEARLNQRKMMQKKNSVLIRKKRMRIKGNRENHELSRKLGCEITHGCAVSRSNWNLGVLFFAEGGKLDSPEKNP